MGFIDQNLLAGERILFRTKKSLFIFSFPFAWIIVCFVMNGYFAKNFILIKVQLAPWLIACLFWGFTWLQYKTSEFAVTNKRVLMREGFFNRHAVELKLATIAQVVIDQSLMGQLCHYGTVSLNAFGAFDSFSMIAAPTAFQKAVNAQLYLAAP